jgi:hypothetical protein
MIINAMLINNDVDTLKIPFEGDAAVVVAFVVPVVSLASAMSLLLAASTLDFNAVVSEPAGIGMTVVAVVVDDCKRRPDEGCDIVASM